MQFYADENFPLRTVKELRRFGFDILTAFEDGKANQAISDEEVLARAAELDRVILTLNRLDFKTLHRNNPNHAGIIICTEDSDRKRQAERIAEKVSEFKVARSLLIRVYRPDK